MTIDVLGDLDLLIKKAILENPNRSLSALFRNLRKKVPNIADFPVLKHIILESKKHGVDFNDNQTALALRSSIDYMELNRGDRCAFTLLLKK